MEQELFEIYQRNLPFIVRDENTVRRILSNADNRVIEERDTQGNLVGAAVVNQSTLLLLCVDAEYRNQGIGSGLLERAEQIVKNGGYDRIVAGVGFDYIMPGVPTSKRRFASENEKLYAELDGTADDFFIKRGYEHAWNCNCFDMRCTLRSWYGTDMPSSGKGSQDKGGTPRVGDTAGGVTYRFADLKELENVCACTDDACPEFTQYYRQKALYQAGSPSRVLSAVCDHEVVGTLIVTIEDEKQKLGSVGCVTVRPAYQGRHIAVNLVHAANRYLTETGMNEAYLSYTYSGLDHMYGYAGYQICIYYLMAQKKL